jgi:hypothetical protein
MHGLLIDLPDFLRNTRQQRRIDTRQPQPEIPPQICSLPFEKSFGITGQPNRSAQPAGSDSRERGPRPWTALAPPSAANIACPVRRFREGDSCHGPNHFLVDK